MRDRTVELFLLLMLCKRDRHNLRLLSKCPKYGARFKIPALWEQERCDRCWLSFAEMGEHKKTAKPTDL